MFSNKQLVILVILLICAGIGIYVFNRNRTETVPVKSSAVTREGPNPTIESRGTYQGESYVGEFRAKGLVTTAEPTNLLVSKEGLTEDECTALRTEVTRRCSNTRTMSTREDVSHIVSTCIFSIPSCPQEVIENGLADLLEPGEIERSTNVFIQSTTHDTDLWHLDRVDAESGYDGKMTALYSGKNTIAYVIDTGINASHEEFTGRIIPGRSFHNKESTNEDTNGHGSHCAGSIGGTQYGVAKDVKLMGVKCMGVDGSGPPEGVVNAIEYAFQDWKQNRRSMGGVMSLSLGGGKSSAMDKAVKAASDGGMIVVVAAGNAGLDACQFSPAGAGGKGRTGGVITVMSSTNKDYRSTFSCYGSCTDIFGPGSDVTSAWMGDSKSKNTISGTSMATPHVAGMMCQLLEKHGNNKSKAIKEAFAIATTGIIADAKSGSRNILMRLPYSTGDMGPLPPDPIVPILKIKAGGITLEKKDSFFGSYDPLIAQGGREYEMVFLDAWDSDEDAKIGCAPLEFLGKSTSSSTEYGTLTEKFVFVQRGDCGFSDKVRNCQRAGAAAVIIYQDSNAVPMAPGGSGDDITIYSGMISRNEAANVREKAKQGRTVTVSVEAP